MLDSVKAQYTSGSRHGGIQNRVDLVVDRRPTGGIRAMIAADKAADRAFDGGFRIVKQNLCHDCFEYRSVNGSCGC